MLEEEIWQEFAQLSRRGDMDMVSSRVRKKSQRAVKVIRKEKEKEKQNAKEEEKETVKDKEQ